MLASERQRIILRRVQESGGVRVTDLARDMNVAEETIRRDLEKLDGDGKLMRTHGGAVPLEPERELPGAPREASNLPAKRAIARVALAHIKEGDVIGLDASTVSYELARMLPDAPLTVVTNSLVVTMSLAGRPRVRVICTGGRLDAPTLSFVGSSAEDAVTRYNISKLFLSCKGVDTARGLSVASDEHARVRRRMMDAADRRYLLVDHGKFGTKSAVIFAQISEVQTVITDTGVSGGLLDDLSNRGVHVERTNS